MSAIFISHSSVDNEFCKRLMAWLETLGHRSLFLDFDASAGFEGGCNWEQKLYRELRVCRALLVVCTEHSMQSKWCFAEITQARSLGKQIFPLRVAPCDVDAVLSDSEIVDFVTLGEKEAFERLKRGLSVAGIDAEDPSDWDGSRPPYPGLLALQEQDAAFFFGRDAEIGQGLDVLNRTHRFGGAGLVVTLGASGSGKSSLVRAGLIPRLKRDPERWLVVRPFRPGEDPFGALADVLAEACRKHATVLPADLSGELSNAGGANSLVDSCGDSGGWFNARQNVTQPTVAEDNSLNRRIQIAAGSFVMGSAEGVGDDDEHPAHRVHLGSFTIQEHEVTNAEYRRLVPTHSFPPGEERRPVVNVTWYAAMAYAAWLGGSLPTEAQWEFAARGPRGREYPWGSEPPTCKRAQFNECAPSGTAEVKSATQGATPEGVYDLAGNVWEWVSDRYGEYGGEEVNDPRGPEVGSPSRVLRGGSFRGPPQFLRGAYRSYPPEGVVLYVGFRVVWTSSGGLQ